MCFFFLPTLFLKNETQTSKKSSEQFLHQIKVTYKNSVTLKAFQE